MQVTENKEEKRSVDVEITSKNFEELIHYLEKNTKIKIGFNLQLCEKKAIFTLECDSDEDLQELAEVLKSFFHHH